MAHASREVALSYYHMPDEEIVSLARHGDQQALDHLLRKYRGLVEGRARRYRLIGAEHEDVVQEGMIGLYKAIRDYSDQRLSAFRSFANLCVTRQIISAVKAARRQKHNVLSQSASLDAPWATDQAPRRPDDFAEPKCQNPEQMLVRAEFQAYVREQVRQALSELESQVLWSYVQGDSYQEISGRLGCTVKCIDNALQRAKRKMARRLACQPA